jgi:hypothetical protein
MSTINGLNGPRLPTATPSAARETSRTSFLSRVQAGSAGAVPLSVNAPPVSGRNVVSQALSDAKSSGSSGAPKGMEGLTEEQQQQMKTIQDMSRSFVMGTVQNIFQGFGQLATKPPDDD